MMLKNKLLFTSLLTVLLIAVFHFLSVKYYWYWTYRWIDIPVHIVGGFWVSLTALWVALKVGHIDSIYGYKKRALVLMLISVLIVAILWEVFELMFKITYLNDIGYWSDSLGDGFNGLIGGSVAFLYFTKNKKTGCLIEDKRLRKDFVIVL